MEKKLLENENENQNENERYKIINTTPQILLETITARTATGVLILTYVIFVLGLVFDIYTTMKGFGGNNIELLSKSCIEQNIIVGITEGNYGCTQIDNSQTSPILTWIGHAQDFSNVISVSVKTKLSNTSSIYYNGSYIDDDEILHGLTFQYDLDLYCCYSDTKCGEIQLFNNNNNNNNSNNNNRKENNENNENSDNSDNGGWKKVVSINQKKIHIDQYLSIEDDDSSTVTLLPNTFQNQESLPTKGKVKSYLVYIRYDEKYSSYKAWSSLTYTFRDISRPNTPIVDTILPILITLTFILFLCYVYCLYTSSSSSSLTTTITTMKLLPEQKWLIIYLIAVIMYQNPIYCIISRAPNPSPEAVYSCYILNAFSEAVLIIVWLLFADSLNCHISNNWSFYLPKFIAGFCIFTVNVVVITLQFPSINIHDTRSPVEAVSNWSHKTKLTFVSFSITLLFMMWYWTIWWFYSLYSTGSALQKLPYMSTRYLQLSFRFFSLQATLVTLYYSIENILIIYFLFQRNTWKEETVENLTDNINTLFRQETLAFGKVIFLSTYGLILAFFFLPSSIFGDSSLLSSVTSLAVTYVVTENELHIVRKKRKRDIQKLIALREFTAAKVDIFCVDLGIEFVSLALESYNDVKGLKTISGYDDLDIDRLGYNLLDYRYNKEHEAICYIAKHKIKNRIVVFFRGTASRQHWSDNLNFAQRRIDLLEMQLTELDLIDGLEVLNEDNRVGINSKWYEDHDDSNSDNSDDDNDNDDNDNNINGKNHWRKSSGGYELVGKDKNSETNSIQQQQDDNDDDTFSLSSSFNQGFIKSKSSFVETARNVEDEIKRAAHTVADAATGVLLTAASHTPILQYAVNTYVHSGFWEIYLTVREFVHSSLRKELSKSPCEVYFIGHSMAGALASYAALDFSIHSLPRIKSYIKHKIRQHAEDEENDQSKTFSNKKIKVGIYTFGSPRVGNWSFSHFLNRIVPNSFRVVVDGDIVTGIPKGNYKHVGTEILIDSSGAGTIIIDPSFVESRLQKSNKTSIEAHSLQSYRRGLVGVKAATEYQRQKMKIELHNELIE